MRHRHTDTQVNQQKERQTDKLTDWLTSEQTDRQTDRQTDKSLLQAGFGACVDGRNQSLKRLFCLGWTGYPAQAHDFVGILQKSPISSLAGWFDPSNIMC